MELIKKNVTFFGKDRKAVKKIYTDAFKKEERMPFFLMIAMAKLWNTAFYAFYDTDNTKPCGTIYLAKIGKVVFIMFFAVDEELRSKGYGSVILEKIRSLYPNKKIVISIERCDEEAEDLELRKRRKNFYLRNGYKETGYLVELAKVKQEIIITNGDFNKREFFWFFILYSNGTMYPKIWKNPNSLI